MAGHTLTRSGPTVSLIAVLVASWACFRPGLVMTDTLARWAGAFTLAHKLDIWWGIELWLAPTMTWFMLPVAQLGVGAGYFLVAQIAFLLLAGATWIRFTSSQQPWWIPAAFCVPIVFVYSSFVIPDVWTLAAMLAVVGCVFAVDAGARFIPGLLFAFSCVVLFGFRQNSLVLVPIVLFYVWRSASASAGYKLALASILAAALATIAIVPGVVGFKGPTSSAAAPAWELVGTLRLAKEQGLAIDESLTLSGIVDTDTAVRKHSFGTIDTLLWGAGAALPTTAIMKHEKELKDRWLRMVIAHPVLYAEMKLRVYECMLGFCDEYLQTRVDAQEPWPQLKGYVWTYKAEGFSASILDTANRVSSSLRFMLLPWFWLPVSVLVFLLSWNSYGRHDRMVIVLAAAYLGSFFILNQAASFRYLFPTYVVFTAYQLRALGGIACRLMQRSQAVGSGATQ